MAKVNLVDVASLANPSSAKQTLNDNTQSLRTALDNTLSRDGTSPNAMAAELDMGHNKVLNVADPVSDTDGVNLRSVRGLVDLFAGQIAETLIEGTLRVERHIATAGQTDFVMPDPVGPAQNVMVFDNGHLLTPEIDYTVANLNTIVFFTGRAEDAEVIFRYVQLSPADSLLRADLAAVEVGRGGSVVKWKQRGTDTVLRDVDAKLKDDMVSVLDYIPVEDHEAIRARTSVMDHTPYFNTALAEHKHVYMPLGTYNIKDALTLQNVGGLHGEYRHTSILNITPDFNMAATAVLNCVTGEAGVALDNFSIYFEQPDTSVRANLYPYPAAIKVAHSPRYQIRNMRIMRAMVGIDATGNSGGGIIENVEMSSFVKGIDFDGSLDSTRVDKLHLWVFGITANQRLIYSDTTNIGIHSGRNDDFHLVNSILFSIPKALVFWDGAGGGGTFGHVSGCDFDGRGGVHVTGAKVAFDGCFWSLAANDSQMLIVNSGAAEISGGMFFFSSSTNPGITINGGAATFSGVSFIRNSVNSRFIQVLSDGYVAINGSYFQANPVIAFTTPFIEFNGGRGTVVGNTWLNRTTGGGEWIEVLQDLGVVATSNYTGGYVSSSPSTVINTLISNNSPVTNTYTPTLTAIANASSVTPTTCHFERIGQTVRVYGRFDVDPVASSTTTSVGISLPPGLLSNFVSSHDAAGTCTHQGATAMNVGNVLADTTSNRLVANFISNGTGSVAFLFDVSYKVK